MTAPPPRLVPDRPSDWLSDLHDHMAHCVSAADEGEDYAVSRPMLDAMTALGLMAKVGRGKWAPTDEGRRFAEARRESTLPIDIRGEWYEVPIPVHLHVIALRDAAAPLAEAPGDDREEDLAVIAKLSRVLAEVAIAIGAHLPDGQVVDYKRIPELVREKLAEAPAERGEVWTALIDLAKQMDDQAARWSLEGGDYAQGRTNSFCEAAYELREYAKRAPPPRDGRAGMARLSRCGA